MAGPLHERYIDMNCNLRGCPGHYETRLELHAVKTGGTVIVFDSVPMEVCDVCSDTLLAPETIRHLEQLMKNNSAPLTHAPVYAYA